MTLGYFVHSVQVLDAPTSNPVVLHLHCSLEFDREFVKILMPRLHPDQFQQNLWVRGPGISLFKAPQEHPVCGQGREPACNENLPCSGSETDLSSLRRRILRRAAPSIRGPLPPLQKDCPTPFLSSVAFCGQSDLPFAQRS